MVRFFEESDDCLFFFLLFFSFSVYCAIFWCLGMEIQSETARHDYILVFISYQQIPVFSSVSTSQVNSERPPLTFRNLNLHHSTLTLSCFSVNESWINPAHRLLTRRRLFNMDTVAAVLMLRLSWISQAATLGPALFFFFSAASMFATVKEGGVLQRCSLSKLRLPCLNSANQKKKKKDLVSRRCILFPKCCFKFPSDFYCWKPSV